jgi:hypothetical protein
MCETTTCRATYAVYVAWLEQDARLVSFPVLTGDSLLEFDFLEICWNLIFWKYACG